MNLHSERTMLKNALLGNYAIGAFNFSNMTMLRAIVDAANEEKSPVILAVSESAFKIVSPQFLRRLIQAVMEDASVPIALHLDHGKTIDAVQSALDIGFNSIMIDGSSKPFNENIELTSKVVEICHKYDASVEGELGRLAGIEDDVNVSAKDASFTNPEEAVYFVEKTNVDSLAIAIGTSHGAFKFNGTPNLDIDRLKKIHAAIPNTPLVLHGASSIPSELVDKCNRYGATLPGAQGIPANIIREATRHGICKVNVDTDIRMAMTAEIREYLSTHPEGFDPRKYLSLSREAIKRIVAQKIDQVLGSANSITTESL